jgi:hypothetical protein
MYIHVKLISYWTVTEQALNFGYHVNMKVGEGSSFMTMVAQANVRIGGSQSLLGGTTSNAKKLELSLCNKL